MPKGFVPIRRRERNRSDARDPTFFPLHRNKFHVALRESAYQRTPFLVRVGPSAASPQRSYHCGANPTEARTVGSSSVPDRRR